MDSRKSIFCQSYKVKPKHLISVIAISLKFGIINRRIFHCISEISLLRCLISIFRFPLIQEAMMIMKMVILTILMIVIIAMITEMISITLMKIILIITMRVKVPSLVINIK